MSPIDITPILPTTVVHSSNGRANPLVQLLQTGRPVSLEVLQVIARDAVSFQSPRGPITLHFRDTSAFIPGARWNLQTDPNSHELVLKPVAADKNTARVVVEGRPDARAGNTVSQQATASNALRAAEPAVIKSEALSGAEKPIVTDRATETLLSTHRREAAVRQNSLNGIFASLQTVASSSADTVSKLPEGAVVQKLAQQILGFRIPKAITANTVRHAVQQSGIFNEANIAVKLGVKSFLPLSGTSAAGEAVEGALPDLKSGDLKTALQSLHQLAVRVGVRSSASAQFLATHAPELPERDGPLYGQKPAPFQPARGGDETLMTRLLDQAIEGLARLKLLQMASLPQGEAEQFQATDKAKLQFNMELPVALSNDQTAIVGLRVTRDGSNPEHDQSGHGRGWSIDLALDTEQTGPIDAHIHLAPKGLHIVLWAGNRDFAGQLQQGAGRLSAELSNEGFDIDDLKILNGRRPDMKKYVHHGAGYYLDNSL